MEQEQVLANFQSLNRTRIERLREIAPKNQTLYFDLLALVFHTNSPILPKTISDKAPAGIAGYQPSKSQLTLAKTLNTKFNTKLRALRHYPISGLYLINNSGLLHYPKQPQYELWLVHSADLSPEQQQHLQNKSAVFSNWSTSLCITTSIRLFADDKLQQSLSNDELDNFYLNGLVIAGAMPVWWLIPPNVDYQSTAEQLLAQRIQQITLLDFGDVTKTRSAKKLVDNTLSLLAHAIENGLTDLLTLFYYHHQCQQFPTTSWLSADLKVLFYHGEVEPLNIDTRQLQLKQLESSDISFETLELIQQSFYIQTEERLSQKVSHPKYPWRRAFVNQRCQTWTEQDEHLNLLDSRHQSHYKQCADEHLKTRSAFQQVSDSLMYFSKQQQISLPPLYTSIEKKLQQISDTKPETIEQLPSGLLPKQHEEHLYLHRFEENGDWKISSISLSSTSQIPLHQNLSLLHILAWAVSNHLLTSNSRIIVSDNTHVISISTVKPLIQQLLDSPLAINPKPAIKAFSQSPKLKHVLLFANLGKQAMAKLEQQGLKLASLQNDPLNYANRGEALILSIDGLICSSWGEWHTFTFSGTTAPLDMLTTFIPWWNPAHNTASLSCWSPSDTYSHIINVRLEELYKNVNAHYCKNRLCGDYFIVIAKNSYLLQWQEGSSDYSIMRKSVNVYAALAKARIDFSASMIDPTLDPSGIFSSLLSYQSDSQITLFLHQNSTQSMSVYLLDEFGSLFLQTYTDLNKATLISHFHHFLSSRIKQKDLKLQFFSIENAIANKWKMRELPLPNTATKFNYLPVIITMDFAKDNAHCTIKCGPKHFSGISNDPALFKQVADFMLSLRKSNNNYPLYITELSFSQAIVSTTRDSILQKQRLEKLLNTR